MPLRLIPAVLFLIAFSSCAVGPQGTYYKPSSPDNSVTFEGGWCSGSAGPPAVINFPLASGASLRVALNPEKEDKVELRLSLKIPQGVTAQFETYEIWVTDPISDDKWLIKPELTLSHMVPPLSANATIDFEKIFPVTNQYLPDNISLLKELYVRIPFSLNNYRPKNVKFFIPNIITSNDVYEVPGIKLVEDKEQFKYDWWPFKEYVLEDDSWAKFGDCYIGGKASSSDSDSSFMGHILIACPLEVKWSFKSNMIRVVDMDTKEERHARFEKIYPNDSLKVSFTAPIYNRASLVLNVFVASPRENEYGVILDNKSHAELIIELPNIFINGKKHQIKSITFKKSIGFGVIPFNC